ncbi:BREX-1 system phosphatase PglZ type A [Listeria costaricensis]|uniref:BREX-1 system phosphatase PglZ type A n=1 Tax=Listeria costaricensis TaxID=2026604 RepID=UPI000C082507|nr:BREX-1 system phosphatase PglZ type A [Listeria costaricensis]
MLQQKINELFQQPCKKGMNRHIAFWYDQDGEYQEQAAQLLLPNIKVLQVNDHNYFQTRYLIEKQFLNQHILLYFPYAQPEPEQNMLLDLELYSLRFKTEPLQDFYSEHQLDKVWFEKNYPLFLNSTNRQQKFLQMLKLLPHHRPEDIEMAILAVLAHSKWPHFFSILLALFEKESRWIDVERFGNTRRFFHYAEQYFGYVSGTPSLRDFMTTLLTTNLISEIPALTEVFESLPNSHNAQILVEQWQKLPAYITFIEQEEWLSQEARNQQAAIDWSKADTFPLFDQLFLEKTAKQLAKGGQDFQNYTYLIKARRLSCWYGKFKTEYQTLQAAIHFFQLAARYRSILLPVEKKALWKFYAEDYYQIDQAYRLFYTHYERLGSPYPEFEKLQETLENSYQTVLLQKLTIAWQKALSSIETKQVGAGEPQHEFYASHVKKTLRKRKRVIVVISDGLRYEIGQEFVQRLHETGQFTASLQPLESEIPSVTEFGMAALLPHQSIELDAHTKKVLVDDQVINGRAAREKQLQVYEEKSIVLTAKEVLQMKREQLREKARDQKIIYIYHNSIDAIADKQITEEKIFWAVEKAMEEMIQLLQKLKSSLSASHFILTADHGFLYSRKAIGDVHKIALPESGQGNRRYFIHPEKFSHDALWTYPLGTGNLYIPKGLDRFYRKGSGAGYVHGGNSLAEIMIPLINIAVPTVKQEIKYTEVSLVTESCKILSKQIDLLFLQNDPVDLFTKANFIEAVFRTKRGEIISNQVRIIADSTEELLEKRLFLAHFIFTEREDFYEDECDLYIKMQEKEYKKEFWLEFS